MLDTNDNLVFVDFGYATCFKGEDDVVKNTVGSGLFFAPEVVRTGLKNKVIHSR